MYLKNNSFALSKVVQQEFVNKVGIFIFFCSEVPSGYRMPKII